VHIVYCFLLTNATLVGPMCFRLILNLLCIFCPVTDIYATVTPIGVIFCMIVYISFPERSSPLLGVIP